MPKQNFVDCSRVVRFARSIEKQFIMKIIQRLSTLVLLILSSPKVSSQNFYGLSNSNFNGINAIYINPAGIADARYRQHFNIIGFGNNLSNDYLSFDLPFPFRKLLTGDVPAQYKTPSGSIDFQSSWIKENLNGKPKNLYMGIELRGPGFMTRITPRAAIAVAMRTRFGTSLTGVSEDLARYAKSQADSQVFNANGAAIIDNRFNFNLNAVQELSATGALVVYNREEFYLKVGGTVKLLMGLGSMYVKNNGINFKVVGSDTVIINSSDFEVGHSNPDIINKLANGSLGAVAPSLNLKGAGVGFDAGAIFEWRPKATEKIQSKNKYLLKVGMSLMDLGKIRYSNNVVTYSANNNTPVTFDNADGDSLSAAFKYGIDSGLNWVKGYARNYFNYTEGNSTYSSSIPSSFSTQVDWNVIKWFYVGMNWTQSFVSKKSIGFRKPSSIVILPRFESRIVEFTLPISVYNDYTDFGLGAFLRLGPVYVGTDNLVKSVSKSSFNGYDFYFGISTGIPAGKKKKEKNNGLNPDL